MIRDYVKLSRLLKVQELKLKLAQSRLGASSNREAKLTREIKDCEESLENTIFASSTFSRPLARRIKANADQLLRLQRVMEQQRQLQKAEEYRIEKIGIWLLDATNQMEVEDLVEGVEEAITNQIHTSRD